MPNTFAYVMLFAWPVLVLFICRDRPVAQSVLIALIGGYLLLPMKTVVDAPLLPAYDKDLAAALAALLVIVFARSRSTARYSSTVTISEQPGWLPRSGLFLLLLVGLILGAIATELTNSEPIVYGPTVVRGLTLYDALSTAQNAAIALIPLVLGRKFFADPKGQLLILRFLMIAGLFYGLLALWEVRMSPQLHTHIYGFFQHSFIQHVRGGSYRPIIFLRHGLMVAMFFLMTLFCAIALIRIYPKGGKGRYIAAAVYLLIVLLACKSMGSIVMAVVFAPVLLLTSSRFQILWAAMIATIFLLYPVLRVNGLIPVERMVSAAEQFSNDRADSLAIRIRNEELFLGMAAEKPLLGWGSGDRSRVFDDSGQDITIADARWVVTLAQGGWVRYVCLNALFCIPLILLARHKNRLRVGHETTALAVILSANIFDLLMNDSITPLTFLFAGSLIGRLELLTDPKAVEQPRQTALPLATLPAGPPLHGAVQAKTPPVAAPARSPYAPVLPETTGWRLFGNGK